MNLLLITRLHPSVRCVATVHRYVAAGRGLGHQVAVYGDPVADLPDIPFTLDTSGVDVALFVVQTPADLSPMPHMARLIDAVPRERRAVVDLWGRYNDTVRIDHDFNHLEKVDHHLGWEWEQAFEALAGRILQPTLKPLRTTVRPFLFHGFDEGQIVRPYATGREAAAAWMSPVPKYGAMYIGSNWQRWHQVRAFIEQFEPIRARATLGAVCLMGWDWEKRPEWAVKDDIAGIDTDPEFLRRLSVDCFGGVRFDEIPHHLGKARFAPVMHRPLFRELGFVTNRTFETFYADSLPVLLLPRDFVAAVYGEAALKLVPGNDLSAHIEDTLRDPETYWDAVIETRHTLAKKHSFATRLRELAEITRTEPHR
jgi:hypothetical protein